MRVHYSTYDNITRHQLILSDCSYNMACDWLQRELDKECWSVIRTESTFNGHHTNIYTGEKRGDSIVPKRKFIYDEDRGYLMGE